MYAKNICNFAQFSCLHGYTKLSLRTLSECNEKVIKVDGLVRDLNPGPLAPKARIMPLDQRAIPIYVQISMCVIQIN